MTCKPTAIGALLCLLLVIVGCSASHQELADEDRAPIENPVTKPPALDDLEDFFSMPRIDAQTSFCEDIRRLERSHAFQQVTWMMTDAEESRAEYRVPHPSGKTWGPWQPAEITFSEGDAYNARILLEEPTTHLELRGDPSIHGAHFSVRFRITARTPALTEATASTPDVAHSCSRFDRGVVEAKPLAVAPPPPPEGLVNSRQDWQAIAPDRLCREPVTPSKLTFHHTFVPGDDGADGASRVRQIQSYHINERGWCDIGYHFLITQNGQIYRGRKQVHRPGAHVGNHNDGNIGVGFIGDFSTHAPTAQQVASATTLTRWLHRAYQIPLDRRAIRGHGEWSGQSTDCPGDYMLDVIGRIVDEAKTNPTDRLPERDLNVSMRRPATQ